jgi:hypothetical protein
MWKKVIHNSMQYDVCGVINSARIHLFLKWMHIMLNNISRYVGKAFVKFLYSAVLPGYDIGNKV